MTTIRIAVLVGSLRNDSINRRLALALAGLAPPGHVFHHVRIDDLPLYDQDDDGRLSEPAQRLKRDIHSADALLFVTPEYNRSIPGVLKNAIDIASRPYGQNSFAGKPAGVIGASVGSLGTALAQQHLRNVLAYLDAPTMDQPEAFIHFTEGLLGANGAIGNDSTRLFLQGWLDKYLAWTSRLLDRPAASAAANPAARPARAAA